MTRLPKPGSDDGTWGNILNDFLSQAHNDDGTLKPLSQDKVANLVSDLAARVNKTDLDTSTASLVSNSTSATSAAVSTAAVTAVQSSPTITPIGSWNFSGATVTGLGASGGGANMMVLGTSDPVPAGTPAGTLIIRTSATVPSSGPPSALNLSAVPGDGQVTISASGGSGATAFALYRGTTATGTPIATSFPYTDTGLTNGTEYSYIATATNSSGTVTSDIIATTPVAQPSSGAVVTNVPS